MPAKMTIFGEHLRLAVASPLFLGIPARVTIFGWASQIRVAPPLFPTGMLVMRAIFGGHHSCGDIPLFSLLGQGFRACQQRVLCYTQLGEISIPTLPCCGVFPIYHIS